MKYNGTALPNQPIEIILEDPLGDEKISDIFEVDKTGIIQFSSIRQLPMWTKREHGR